MNNQTADAISLSSKSVGVHNLHRYAKDRRTLARRLGAQVVIARDFSVDAAAIITGPDGPVHSGPSYIGALHICPRSLAFLEYEIRQHIGVAGAVADLYGENVGIAECSVLSRMNQQDCALAGIPMNVQDRSCIDFVEPTAREVAYLLQGKLADEWYEATRSLIVAFDGEVVYLPPCDDASSPFAEFALAL